MVKMSCLVECIGMRLAQNLADARQVIPGSSGEGVRILWQAWKTVIRFTGSYSGRAMHVENKAFSDIAHKINFINLPVRGDTDGVADNGAMAMLIATFRAVGLFGAAQNFLAAEIRHMGATTRLALELIMTTAGRESAVVRAHRTHRSAIENLRRCSWCGNGCVPVCSGTFTGQSSAWRRRQGPPPFPSALSIGAANISCGDFHEFRRPRGGFGPSVG